MAAHQLEVENKQIICRKCEWTWKRVPVSDCPGVPRYQWGFWPENLKTKTQLRKMKLKVPAEPRGAYFRNSKAGKTTQFMWLYDVNEARNLVEQEG